MTAALGYLVLRYGQPTLWDAARGRLETSVALLPAVPVFADRDAAEFAIRKTVEGWKEHHRQDAYRVFQIVPLIAAPAYRLPTKDHPIDN